MSVNVLDVVSRYLGIGAPPESHSPGVVPTGGEDSVCSESREAAEVAYRSARNAFEMGTAADDKEAMRLLEQSLSLHALPEAQALLSHLRAFGPGSAALAVTMRTLKAKSHREVLALGTGPISPASIKRKYKQLCLELHPDRCGARGAEEAFKRVQEAYGNLRDGGIGSSSRQGGGAKKAEGSSRGHHVHRRRGKAPPGTTSGARWGHGAEATRGKAPPQYVPEPHRPGRRPGSPTKAPLPKFTSSPQPRRPMGPMEA